MNLQGLLTALSRASTIDVALREALRNADFSAPAGLDAPLLAGLLARRAEAGLPPALLAITATSREGESLRASLAPYLSDAEVLEFPAWETLPHERLSPSAETVGRRLHALRRMHEWSKSGARHPLVVVASVRAALQPLADNLAELAPIELVAGGRGHDLSAIAVQLVDLAYARVDMVARRGEFAVRGGILDVFPPTADHPVRVEFFGDEVEEVRSFSVADQRSLPEPIERVSLAPSRELLLTAPVRQRAREMVHEFPSLAGLLEKVAEGIPVEGMESLAPALLDRLVPLSHYLPEGAAVAVLAPERVAGRAVSLGETNREFLSAAWSAATAGAEAPIDLAAGDFLTVRQLRDAALFSAPGEPDPRRVWWNFSSFDIGDAAEVVASSEGDGAAAAAAASTTVRLAANAMPSFQGNVAGAVDHAAERLRDGWSLVVASAGHGLVERARDVLAEAGLAARLVDEVPADLEPGVAYLVQADAARGYEVPEVKLGLIAEAEFYGRAAGYDARQGKKLASRRRNVVDPLQLKQGDYVVHQTHGIGRFVEMVQREVATGSRPTGPSRTAGIQQQPTAVREYLVLEYAPSKRGHAGDRLFVPTDQLDLLSRYVGGEAPSLSKMGGSDWAQAKGKARRAVRDIAVELVKLYSARMAAKGYAFSADTPWQHELEEAFPFVETPDQVQTIDEVKADMERPIPMDRLLAGDVGFGKTEVAVRAAFKAIQDGKQVAMLVPTTLLVKQHLETFNERFAGFPVHVRALSRFQTDKEARETVAGLADGTVDMVIGTHRILTEKVQLQGCGPPDHRRRAAVRRRAQGLAQEAEDQRRHPRDERDPDPAFARDGRHRHPRDVDARDPARRPAPDPHLRRARTPSSRWPRRSGARCCARARSSSCTTACRRSTGLPRSSPSSCPRPASPSPTDSSTSTCSSRSSSTSGSASSTCWSRRPSSRPASTSRTRTRSSSTAPTSTGSRSCTSCAGGSAAAASAPTRTSSTTRPSRSPRPRTTACRPSPRTTSSGRACRSR